MAKDRLTDTALKGLKAREKPYKKADGGGLYVLVNSDGSKYWRFKYRYRSKEKLLSMGTYPTVSLKKARDRREAAKRLLSDKVDPSAVRKAEKNAECVAKVGPCAL